MDDCLGGDAGGYNEDAMAVDYNSDGGGSSERGGSSGSSTSSSDDDDVLHLVAEAANLLALDIVDSDDTSSSDEGPRWGGSAPGRRPNKPRDFEAAYQQLRRHYFSGQQSLYDEGDFERRFSVPRSIFQRVWEAIHGHLPFVRRVNRATQKPGIHPLTRLVACFRMLSYGNAKDASDEYLQLSETSADESLKSFCMHMVNIFGPTYLNQCPDDAAKERSLSIMARRGFPGCFASWDCKHFCWSNCPVRLAGQHRGKLFLVFLIVSTVTLTNLLVVLLLLLCR